MNKAMSTALEEKLKALHEKVAGPYGLVVEIDNQTLSIQTYPGRAIDECLGISHCDGACAEGPTRNSFESADDEVGKRWAHEANNSTTADRPRHHGDVGSVGSRSKLPDSLEGLGSVTVRMRRRNVRAAGRINKGSETWD